jgi:NAD(P)H-dependent FMN reductase
MDKIGDVAVIVGSLWKDSINRKVANTLAAVAPAGLKLGRVSSSQALRKCGDAVYCHAGPNLHLVPPARNDTRLAVA